MIIRTTALPATDTQPTRISATLNGDRRTRVIADVHYNSSLYDQHKALAQRFTDQPLYLVRELSFGFAFAPVLTLKAQP